jgi:hypothetical protein
MGMRHARQHSAADDNQRNTPRTALDAAVRRWSSIFAKPKRQALSWHDELHCDW